MGGDSRRACTGTTGIGRTVATGSAAVNGLGVTIGSKCRVRCG